MEISDYLFNLNMMNTYRKLQKRVNEILKRDNDSLGYLEYGDEILVYNDGYDLREAIFLSKQNDIITFIEEDCCEYVIRTMSEYNEIQILGKPPTLQDLLRCLKEKIRGYEEEDFVQEEFNRRDWEIMNIINIDKDIKYQDEEVLESIYKLIS